MIKRMAGLRQKALSGFIHKTIAVLRKKTGGSGVYLWDYVGMGAFSPR